MGFRFLLPVFILGILIVGSLSFGHRAAQDVPAEVSLGGVTWAPTSIPPGNTSKLRVSVATTSTVPTTGIKAILSIYEAQNFGGVSYTMSPAEIAEVVLMGGGGHPSGSSH